MNKTISFHIFRDVGKAHELALWIGKATASIQFRGWQPRDDGKDPWMLTIGLGFGDSHKFFRLIEPLVEIPATSRLSLALHGKGYWCDDQGPKNLAWLWKRMELKKKEKAKKCI